MASQEISAQTEIYFKDNWTQTPLEYITLSEALDTSEMDEYISIKYFSLPLNRVIGMNGANGRKAYHGYLRVLCYQRDEALALGLADDVCTFFDCKQLPSDITVSIGQDEESVDMDNGWFEVELTFDIVQY